MHRTPALPAENEALRTSAIANYKGMKMEGIIENSVVEYIGDNKIREENRVDIHDKKMVKLFYIQVFTQKDGMPDKFIKFVVSQSENRLINYCKRLDKSIYQTDYIGGTYVEQPINKITDIFFVLSIVQDDNKRVRAYIQDSVADIKFVNDVDNRFLFRFEKPLASIQNLYKVGFRNCAARFVCKAVKG